MPREHRHGHDHGHAQDRPHGDRDWGAVGAGLELEGEVTMPLLREALDAIGRAAGSVDDVRSVLDLGSGPGVASVALAQAFPSATVTAVDASDPLLDLARARAARLGVPGRIETRVADLERSLAEVAAPGSVDLVWASMVLHHLVELPGTLAEVHRLLRPGGLLAIAEMRSLHGTLPVGFEVGRAGLVERLAGAVRASLEEHLPPGAMTTDWPALLAEAGFDLFDHRVLAMGVPGPLDDAARRLVVQQLQGSVRRTEGQLDDGDIEVLTALADVTDPRSLLHREDLSLTISRRFLLARRR